MSNESKTNTTIHFHVATNGNDAWSGTLPEPNAAKTDGPFATLRRARDAVRAAIKAGQAAQAAWEMERRVRTVELPTVWSFRRDPADAGEAAGWFAADPDAGWTELCTDKSWTKQGHDYHGVAWYSVAFTVPAAARAGRRYRLCFGAVDGCCRIWLDGREIGAQLRPPEEMWDQPFGFDVGDALASGLNHRLVVRVVKDKREAGVWKPVRFEPVDEAAPPAPQPVTVLVRGGKYFPEQTLHLSAADSGTADAPVTYAAYPGETPVISGGRRVTDWKPYREGIYVAEIPETRGQGLFFRQLYANGERQVRSRYPKADSRDPRWNGRWAHSRKDDAAVESWPSDPRLVWDEPDAFKRPWAKPTQGEVYFMPAQNSWGDICLARIRSVDPANHIIRLAHGARDFNANPFFCCREGLRPEYSQFIVENLLEELTEPGEWCLDTEEGRLYFRPAKGSIADLEVVIPAVKCLLHMERVEHVRVSGLTFTETLGGEPSSQYTDVEGVGALFPPMGWEYIGETVYLSDCKGCRLEHSRIVNVGGNGIYMRNGNEANLIRHNEIAHVGGHGVALAGARYRPYADPSLGAMPGGMPDIPPHPRFNEITDNAIHHIGLVDTYTAGVFLGLGAWNRVAHNEIHDVAHLAVSLGNYQFGRNCIEYNRIARAGRVTNDTGAINCWNEATLGAISPPAAEAVGHVIRYNHISDTGNTSHGDTAYHHTCGVYLDNWTSNCLIYGNLVVNEAMGVVLKGRNNIVQNNLFVGAGDCGIALMSHASYPEHAAMVSNNIFYGGSPQAALLKIADRTPRRRVLWQCDNNLCFRPGDPDPVIGKSEGRDVWRMAAWREMSSREGDAYDANSLVADPLFVDPAAGDYRLRPDSPALALGFVPIPVERIGIRKG